MDGVGLGREGVEREVVRIKRVGEGVGGGLGVER